MTTQHNTTQHNTTQHNTTQHNTNKKHYYPNFNPILSKKQCGAYVF